MYSHFVVSAVYAKSLLKRDNGIGDKERENCGRSEGEKRPVVGKTHKAALK